MIHIFLRNIPHFFLLSWTFHLSLPRHPQFIGGPSVQVLLTHPKFTVEAARQRDGMTALHLAAKGGTRGRWGMWGKFGLDTHAHNHTHIHIYIYDYICDIMVYIYIIYIIIHVIYHNITYRIYIYNNNNNNNNNNSNKYTLHTHIHMTLEPKM